ncbi:MAG TPA: OmpA family protein, partial [Saprospiraceae bacterium]
MGIVGKQIKEKGLDAKGLKTLLKDQKAYLNEYLPKGMNEALGLSTKPGMQKQEPGNTQGTGETSFSKLLPWIVLLITALGLYYFVQKGCNPPVEEKQASAPAPVTIDTATSNYVMENDPFKAYTLPDGTLIKALPNSFTGKLAEFLASSESGEKCFIFDRVNFESGSFKIAAGSERQLRQLASLLKGYPEIKVSIEGHTDDEGDDSKNKNLSKERSRVIKEWLVEQEIAPGRMDAKGWGEEKPIASNDTPGGREKNRRIEVCAIKK